MARATTLTRREFFHDVVVQTRLALPEDLREFQSSVTMNLVKLYYGHPRLHYEVWANARDNHIEVGLHFEDGPESTEQLIAFFDGHIVEIKHDAGPEIDLERWTPSWGHLYQMLPYQPLTETLARDVAARLARMIAVLQPLLTEADARVRLGGAGNGESAPRLATRGRGRWRKR
ncbi:MAG TPA: hypothetical protein VMU89_15995 [Thermomicrobiaceae bacterium]|nr:hypothetical protein [Thermomicrobiaceae bacterium]